MKRIINSKVSAAVIASAVLLASGGGVAYAADNCPGMGGTSTTGTTGSTGTTSTTSSTATTSAVTANSSREPGVRHRANRHAGRL